MAKYQYDNSVNVDNLINYILHFYGGIRHSIISTGIYISIKIYPKFFRKYVKEKVFEKE